MQQLRGILSIAIEAASLKRNYEITTVLLEAGGSVNATDRFGLTALMMASWAGHKDLCIFLLASRADPNKQDNAGWTALHNAVLGDHDEIVRLLLRHGADVTAVTNDGMSCLTLANHVQALQSLRVLAGVGLHSGAWDIAAFLNTTALDGSVEALKSLMEALKFDPNLVDSMGRNAAHSAALGGNLGAMMYLQSQGTSLVATDKMGRRLIDYATMGGSPVVVDKVLKLLTPDTAKTEGIWSPLHWACRHGDIDVIQRLLDYGYASTTLRTTEPDHSWSPIDIAIYHGSTKLLDEKSLAQNLGPQSSTIPPPRMVKGFVCDACEAVSERGFPL
jgi:ankyrin repeat protein